MYIPLKTVIKYKPPKTKMDSQLRPVSPGLLAWSHECWYGPSRKVRPSWWKPSIKTARSWSTGDPLWHVCGPGFKKEKTCNYNFITVVAAQSTLYFSRGTWRIIPWLVTCLGWVHHFWAMYMAIGTPETCLVQVLKGEEPRKKTGVFFLGK